MSKGHALIVWVLPIPPYVALDILFIIITKYQRFKTILLNIVKINNCWILSFVVPIHLLYFSLFEVFCPTILLLIITFFHNLSLDSSQIWLWLSNLWSCLKIRPVSWNSNYQSINAYIRLFWPQSKLQVFEFRGFGRWEQIK